MSAVEKIGHIKNPLTIIAMFAVIAEVSGAAVLPWIDVSVQRLYVWFLMLFPGVLVLCFFGTLNWNRKSLYAPSDFKDEDLFMKLLRAATFDEVMGKAEGQIATNLADGGQEQPSNVLDKQQTEPAAVISDASTDDVPAAATPSPAAVAATETNRNATTSEPGSQGGASPADSIKASAKLTSADLEALLGKTLEAGTGNNASGSRRILQKNKPAEQITQAGVEIVREKDAALNVIAARLGGDMQRNVRLLSGGPVFDAVVKTDSEIAIVEVKKVGARLNLNEIVAAVKRLEDAVPESVRRLLKPSYVFVLITETARSFGSDQLLKELKNVAGSSEITGKIRFELLSAEEVSMEEKRHQPAKRFKFN